MLAAALSLGLIASVSNAPDLAIIGATVIDVSHAGHAIADIEDSVVLISHGRVLEVGERGRVRLPPHVRKIDATGRFVIPGLIDGFGALRTQGFADAYLYEGVTTVIVPTAPENASIDGEARIVAALAGPSVLLSTPVSGYAANGDIPRTSPWQEHRLKDTRLGNEALRAEVKSAAARGSQVIAAGQDVWPDQLDAILGEAHGLGLAVTAQLAFTPYPYAVAAGVDAFVRNDRYQLTLSRPQDFLAYANDPMGPGGRAANRSLCQMDSLGDRIEAFGSQLAMSGTALMPALSIEATADDVGGPNPWTLRAAAFVSPGDLDDPVDPHTGERPYLVQHADARGRLQACARSKQQIDRRLHGLGATYTAGSAAPSYGVMPGGGLHVEMRLLQGIGLTPREALASATSNVAEALRLADRGRIERGRRGDLVILAEDPRRDIGAVDAISAVIIEGRVVDRERLMTRARAHGHSQPPRH